MNAPNQSRSHYDEFPGCCLKPVINLLSWLVIYLLVRAVVDLGYWTFAVIPAIGAGLFLIQDAKFLFGAFANGSTEKVPPRRRVRITAVIFVLALTLTGCAIFTKGDLLCCLGASSLWLAYVHVQQKTWQSNGQTENFMYRLVHASEELLIITSVSLLGYWLFARHMSRLPADQDTVEHIKAIEKTILCVHEKFEKAELSKLHMLILTGVLFILRFVEIRYFPKREHVSRVNKIVKGGFKWFSRIGIIALVPASFTFLATGPSAAPFQSLEARVKSLKKEYGYLRGAIAAKLVTTVEWRLIEKSWEELSPDDQSTLRLAASLSSQEQDTLSKIKYAENRKKRREELLTEWSRSVGTYRWTSTARDVADAATSNDVSDSEILNSRRVDIVSRIPGLSTEDGPSKLKNEMGDELFKSVTAYVQDSIRPRYGNVELTAFLSGYPILKEFLDPVVDAMKETFLPQIKERANAVAQAILKDPYRTFNESILVGSTLLYESASMHVVRADIGIHASEQIQSQRAELTNLETNLGLLILPQKPEDFEDEYSHPDLRWKDKRYVAEPTDDRETPIETHPVE